MRTEEITKKEWDNLPECAKEEIKKNRKMFSMHMEILDLMMDIEELEDELGNMIDNEEIQQEDR